MELNLKRLSEQAIESTTGSKNMVLSDDASSMVFELFTSKVYSNPIGTVVREITSNCFDSHTEAGITAPVIIRKSVIDNVNFISFIDFGVGMSPDRIYNIYGTYFKSTKRVDNTQIGGFGIGGKTPLAYKRSTGEGENEFDSSFFIITRFNGMEYSYCVYLSEQCPVIADLHKEPTTESNGTEIRIPVLEDDLDKFKAEMLKQLYYFENIIFEGFEYESEYEKDENGNPKIIYPMSNDYQIIRGKSFLFRGEDYNKSMHVCLGRVAYPIDYSVLDLYSSDYELPIALKLEVGDVGVTVNREQLDYSKKTIGLLKAKLEEAKAEIKTLISKQYESITTLEQYFEVKSDFGKLEFPNGTSLSVGDLIKQSDVDFSNFKYQFMKMPNDKQLFKFFFATKQMGKKPKKSRYSYNRSENEFTGGYETVKTKTNVLYFNDEFNRKVIKQAWLKDRFETYYLISKRRLDVVWMKSEIADLFNVSLEEVVTTKGNPVKFVKELLKMQEEYWEIVQRECDDYDTLEIPEDFIASRKRGAGITPEIRKQTIPVKFVGGYSKDRVKLSVLFDYNMPIFYGTSEEEYELRRAQKVFDLLFDDDSCVTHCSYDGVLETGRGHRRSDDKKKSSIAFVQIAQGNLKYMKHCKKAYPISEFKWRMAHRKESNVRQFFITNQVIEKFNELSGFYVDGFIDKVSTDVADKVKTVREYIQNIPSGAKNESIKYCRSDLERYYDLSDLTPSKEQTDMEKVIDEVLAVQEKNQKTLRYFSLPYGAENLEEEMITILQVSLTF